MHNPRAAAASLPCSLQIKSLAKGLCALRFGMDLHSPGRIKAAFGGKARAGAPEPGLQLCLGSAAPRNCLFSAEFCTSKAAAASEAAMQLQLQQVMN